MNVYLPNLRLPSTYQEVEYIQSSGTQYIIIGTSFKTSYKTVIDFQMTQIGGDYIPVGIKYNTTRYGIDVYNSKFMVNGGGQTWSNTISEDTNRHTITIDKGTARVDGNNYSVSYTDYTFSKGIGVFCYNEYDKSPQYNYKSSNKLYKLDIYDENGTHINDLVPCYRKSDNVIGMYDLVNSVFYTNAGTGTFSKGNDVTMAELKNAYIGEYIIPYLGFTANTAGSTVKLNKNGTPTAVTLETSTDGTTWTTYTIGDTITLANIGDKVYFRNTSETDTPFSRGGTHYYKFNMTGSIAGSGDVTYLLNKNSTNTLSTFCFYQLFYSCSSLTSAPSISATILNSYCCTSMFAFCTGLISLPKLSAITLSDYCYQQMFYYCSNIKLSSTQTGDYQTAYRIPVSGTGTTGTNSLYNMFDSTGGTLTGTPTINTTYYTSNTVV